MAQLHDLTAAEQVRKMHSRGLSPVELTEHYLARIERLNARVGAYITVSADVALRAARDAEQALMRGPEGLPPLLGLPVAIKDLAMTAGIRTTLGSRAFSDWVPDADSHAVTMMKGAGLTGILGKTNTPEFGPACYTKNALAPEAVTPWDLGRSASGSSGGAGAAVASGLAPLAHGSDRAGSVRSPAAVSGLVGFKPGRGVVSPSPQAPLIPMATDGAIARTVEDAALLIDAMSGSHPGDLYQAAAHGPMREAIEREPPPLRIAAWSDTGLGNPVDPEVEDCLARALLALEALGHHVDRIPEPTSGAIGPATDAVFELLAAGVDATVMTIPEERRDQLQPYTRFLADHARSRTSTQLIQALTRLGTAGQSALVTLQDHDVFVSPTTAAPAVPVGTFNGDDMAECVRRMTHWTAFTFLASITGQPAVSLPLGETSTRLPIGIQLTSRTGNDGLLFSLSRRLEVAMPWGHRHPPIWGD
ncbi:MAG: amidase [Chloroflexota bacterium]|jgi:amidase|nr:amidase [Chloroflexota bacterium]